MVFPSCSEYASFGACSVIYKFNNQRAPLRLASVPAAAKRNPCRKAAAPAAGTGDKRLVPAAGVPAPRSFGNSGTVVLRYTGLQERGALRNTPPCCQEQNMKGQNGVVRVLRKKKKQPILVNRSISLKKVRVSRCFIRERQQFQITAVLSFPEEHTNLTMLPQCTDFSL